MSHSRRAFSLIETIVVILVIALAVPGLLSSVQTTSVDAIDAQRRVAAAWLASSVLESVQADAASAHPSRGFEAIDDSTYLDDPTEGLYARLAPLLAPLQNLGLSYTVSVESPIDLDGAAAAPSDQGAMRQVSVIVSFSDRSGRDISATFSTVVVNL